ncbi:MAG: hypothetical protein HWN68_08315 [Desulfobacterales bacterium]|nr:hypothetical protein [Desulfobacterales bacterium]
MDFEELWLVDEDEEANELIKFGWKFIQVVYEDKPIKEWKGFLGQTLRTVATAKEAKFLLGRPKGVEPRGKSAFDSLESLDEYVERLEKLKEA